MRRNWDLSMMVLIIILAFSSFRSGAFSSPMEWLMNKLMFLPAIIIGLSLHEYAHAKVAYKLGDPTPKMQDVFPSIHWHISTGWDSHPLFL